MDKGLAFRKIIIFCLVVTSVLQVLTAYTIYHPIETSTGTFKAIGLTIEDKNVDVYTCIPYAEPPVGHLRFKKPVSKKQTKKLQDCFKPNASHQYSNPAYNWVPRSDRAKDEDCLYMNIFVPHTAMNSKLAVMIWLHTGDFSSGTMWPLDETTNPATILAALGDVIIVQVQYRLGIFGFLWADTDEAPGNMGLFDVLEAMKWINTNIEQFGGDADRITLAGHGAGGIIAGLMCTSPLAQGMFQRAILMAGSPAYPLNSNKWKNAKLAQKVAKAVDCAPGTTNILDNPKDVITCLRSKDASLLVNVSAELNDDVAFGFSTILGDDLLYKDPRQFLICGSIHDVEVMVGHTQDEGSYLLAKTDLETFGAFGQKNPQINKTVAANYIRKALKGFSPELVVQHYLGDLKDDDYDAIRQQAYHALGDFFIGCPDMYFAEQYARKNSKVYAYYFNHIPSVRHQWSLWMGAGHLDDGPFFFGKQLEYKGWKYTQAEKKLSRRIIKLLANFVKTGEPGENWQQFSKRQPNFMEFNITNRTSYLETHKKNCDFFRPIFDV